MSTHTSQAPEWRLKKFSSDDLAKLDRLGLSRPFVKTLLDLGLSSFEEANSFLNPSMTSWTHGASFPSLDQNVENVWALVQQHQPVCIHGDFDSDGLCASMVLKTCLEALNIECFHHLPARKDGHGVSITSLKKVIQRGAKMVITVDCGVSAMAEAEFCRQQGIPLVITDHHLPDADVPCADAIINPQLDEVPGAKSLCGAGVALKLALGLSRLADPSLTQTSRYQSFFKNALVLSAVATVADVMPLLGDNRSLVGTSLKLQADISLPGLKHMMSKLKLNENSKAEQWAFQLIPRLNSAQRMERSELLEDLFTCDESTAPEVIQQLDDLNMERRQIQKDVNVIAVERAASSLLDQLVWVRGTEWKEGFSGLIANHLVGLHHRPSGVMVECDGHYHGSMRAPKGYHLKHALDHAADLLVQYGGHAQAAGFKVKANQCEALQHRLNDYFSTNNPLGEAPKLTITDHLPFPEVQRHLLDEQDRLEPFGQGNPKPIFATKGVLIDGGVRVIGADGTHVSFRVFLPGHESVDCIGFGKAQSVLALDQHGRIDIAYHLGTSPYNGRLQLNLQAIRQHQTPVVH